MAKDKIAYVCENCGQESPKLEYIQGNKGKC